MDYPNEHLLRKVIDGDQYAFADLYNFYRTPALKFCYSLLKDEEEAESMLQEVFMKIWDRRKSIRPELNFSSYLFTCLRNMAFDELKKMEKNNQLKKRYLESMEAAREDDKEEKEVIITALYTAVDALSEKRKLILQLNIDEGKSYQEIAESMNISKNTVKNQLVKAKQILREKMDFAAL
ncbi:RNA polymerase sigma factor [Telluribacter sp. SYSU D00476]|uniref:RNA polymerase sigma factor n=1 Tax=Telluribacter sp. SYSU D00476 TaxID=2811430 RepID=UPI001FF4D49F|nr:RNA polymerase sigma-70 factor [Telluribacter sp. SYSU D00476]